MPLNPQLVTLGDLARDKRVLSCRCRTCHHRNNLAPETVIHRTGPHLRVAWAKQYLRCSRCGSKDVEAGCGERPHHPYRYPEAPER